MRPGRRPRNVRLAPLGWVLIGAVLLALAAVAFAPRPVEAPALAVAAILLLAIVRGVSAERYGADRRGPPAIPRFGVSSTIPFERDPSARRGNGVIPAEPLGEADEIDQDLMLLQERLRREAAGRT